MSSQKQQLRLKIKKLKYKIQKEQKLSQQYNSLANRLSRLDQQKLTIAKVLKKINFFLSIKGMTMMDWLKAYPYDEQLQVDHLVKVLDNMGIKLPRQERGLLINFMGEEFSQFLTQDDFKRILRQNDLQPVN